MLKKLLISLKQGTEYLNYGREIVVDMARSYVEQNCATAANVNVLDIGVGTGVDLLNIQQSLSNRVNHLSLYGVDSFPQSLDGLQSLKIPIFQVNIENERLPFENCFFDIVVANQVIEHTKEIFWIFSEISRVLKPNAVVIVGVPNLASFHNRILLMLGEQPSSIELLGPHVRGITKNSFQRFITADGYFQVLGTQGSNFYPFPPLLSKTLSKVLPTLSVSLFFLCQRTAQEGTFIEILKSRYYETNYVDGNSFFY